MSSRPDFDVAVIGGGIVGLSVGYYCSEKGLNTVVLERHDTFCDEASTHNSGVIHSGFNPEAGTRKAAFNVSGSKLLYEKAEEWGFGVKKVGTIVAARNDGQVKRLKELYHNGIQNGVHSLRLLDAAGVKEVEPHLSGVTAALFAPDDGVINLMEFIARLKARALLSGTILAERRTVVGGAIETNGTKLSLGSGETFTSRFVVNCAGIHSDDVAAMFGSTYKIYPCVGEYASVVGEDSSLIRGVVYPVVEQGFPGLGVHLTKTFDGQLQIGPTAVYGSGKDPVRWQKTPLREFTKSVQLFLPEVNESSMREGWYGVRAKTVSPDSGKSFGDFVIEWDRNGINVIHLIGIESPGLTASLALGRTVSHMVAEKVATK